MLHDDADGTNYARFWDMQVMAVGETSVRRTLLTASVSCGRATDLEQRT